MPDYSKSKIYKIVSDQTNKIYIGSTIEALSRRMTKHRNDYRRWKNGKRNYITSFEILKYDDAIIELIEKYPCDDKDELRAREGYYQKKLKDKSVNQRIAGRGSKEYYQDNKDSINERRNKKYNCVCGGRYTYDHKSHHLKTKMHQDYIKKHSGADSSSKDSIDC